MDKQPGSIRAVDGEVIERLFMALHGYYGALFFDKFKLGEMRDGKDTGIENAKRVWGAELSGFTAAEVLGALRKTRDSGQAFAPSLPEFIAACKSCRRAVPFEAFLALPASTPGRLRERLTEQRLSRGRRASGGLATLFAVTARAVAAANSDDEVAVLRRLEREILRPPA